MPNENRNLDKVLQAALHIVALSGPSKLSIAGVAEAAGVSRGTVYRHFANSDDLLNELSNFIWDRFESAILPSIESGDSKRAIMDFVTGNVDPETQQAVGRLRELQPAYTLNFFIQHRENFTRLCMLALENEFATHSTMIEIRTFAEIICRIAMMDTLLMQDREHSRHLVGALWELVSGDRQVETTSTG